MIALFGGRFDPIHNGHLAVAKEILKVNVADEVWFSLEYQHQWRPIIAPIEDRAKMVKLAIEEEIQKDLSLVKKLKVDMTPTKLGGMTETLLVVRELRKQTDSEIVFIAGSDQLAKFREWTYWKELEEEVKFLIIARKGSPIENVPRNCVIIEDPTYEPLDDSATRIRDHIKDGKSISGLVPEKVEEYILENGLYK